MIFEKHILSRNLMPDITKALGVFSSQTMRPWHSKLLNQLSWLFILNKDFV